MPRKRLAILIPVILDIGVAVITPMLIDQHGLAVGIMLSAIALVAPWVPFAIISLAVDKEISDEKNAWKEKEERDFV